MTDATTSTTAAGQTRPEMPAVRLEGSYVDWSAVFAGGVTAAAFFFLFSVFGAAVGLSVVSPWTYGNPSAEAFGIGTAIWFIVIQIASFAMGGYVAGRMRRRFGDATGEESEFRDGAHGLLVWALAFLFSAMIVAMTASAVVRGGMQAAWTAGTAMQQAPVALPGLDQLLRPNRPAPDGRTEEIRAEVGRILADAVGDGQLSETDRQYLAQVVAARTGIQTQEADRRVTNAFSSARNAADAARRTAVLTGFLTAASLLASLAAAWLAAQGGGGHRDQGTGFAALSENLARMTGRFPRRLQRPQR